MNTHEEKLKKFMKNNNIHGEHLSFQESCHSVEEAAKTANANKDDFVKNICMVDQNNNLIVAIVKNSALKHGAHGVFEHDQKLLILTAY